MKPILLITVGDPAGIGPEIAFKSLLVEDLYRKCIPVLVAEHSVLEKTVRDNDWNLTLNEVSDPREAKPTSSDVYFVPVNVINESQYNLGEVNPLCGDAAFKYVVAAIELAMENKADAVVTGPLNKQSMNMAGHNYSGHTEIFAEYTGTKDYAMMLASGNLRVIHVSTHVALRDACNLATKDRVLKTIKLGQQVLQEIGIENPSIGVAGLNPHSSENGLFGYEEEKEIIPAINAAKAMGINVTGPVPPDTVFVKAIGGQYDIVVAMYHDQGHIPLKLSGFKIDHKTGSFTSVSGINCTIGLPIIRTSVDHGTAFDMAGKGTANEESMTDAISMAIVMANNKKNKA